MRKKKLLSLFSSIMLLFMLLPITAAAEDGELTETLTEPVLQEEAVCDDAFFAPSIPADTEIPTEESEEYDPDGTEVCLPEAPSESLEANTKAAGEAEDAVTADDAGAEQADDTEEAALPGDINGDGEITSGDIAMLKALILGKIEPTEETKVKADIDGDGEISSGDLVKLKSLMLEKDN